MARVRGRRPARLLVACVVAALAAAAAAAGVAPVGPSLEVISFEHGRSDAYALHGIQVRPRGGEMVDEVALETLEGPAVVVFADRVRDLPPWGTMEFKVQVNPGKERVVVRLVMHDEGASEAYPVVLREGPERGW